jgi:nitrogen fixation protein FixH
MATANLRGIHVFWLVAAFFGVMTAVQVVFVTQAIATFPGEDEHNSYFQGLDYNRTLDRRDSQRRLGWRAQAGFGPDSALVVRLVDAAARPVENLQVIARVRRPGASEGTIAFTEQSAGEYTAPFAAAPGRLEIAIEARRGPQADILFEAEKSLVVP